MLTWSQNPDCRLIEIHDLHADPPPPEIADDLEPLHTIARWAREYLSRPHPELGREGPVCPYAEGSRRKGFFYMSVRRGTGFDAAKIRQTLLDYRDWFEELEPRTGNDSYFKTILILFPDLDPAEVKTLIDGTQEALKPEYVSKGLMLGEFHAGPPDKAGLWNDDFRPLASPVPMLVIRNMVATDFGFLKHDRELVARYVERYGEHVPAHIRGEVDRSLASHGLPPRTTSPFNAIHPRVREVLEKQEVAVTVHRHADLPGNIDGPRAVAEALGWPLHRITKSLFLRCHCHDQYSILVCPVDRRADLAAAAGALGRTRLELASQEELAAYLEYSPGGVSPICPSDAPVLLDESLLEHPAVLVGGGRVEVEIEIDPRDLRDVTGANVMALTLAPASRRAGERRAGREAVG